VLTATTAGGGAPIAAPALLSLHQAVAIVGAAAQCVITFTQVVGQPCLASVGRSLSPCPTACPSPVPGPLAQLTILASESR